MQKKYLMKKYIVRAAKYYIYILVILTVIILALSLLKVVDSDPGKMFVNGYDSLWQIALMLLFFALIYPAFGYRKMSVVIPGPSSEIMPQIKDFMQSRGYTLDSEDGEDMSFIRSSFVMRLTRTFEDRITMTREMSGYRLEGLSKDVVRLAAGLRDLSSRF